VKISAEKWTIQRERFYGFPQLLQADDGIISLNMP
jgi:hypothetical protein